MVNNEVIINAYSNLCPALLICSDLITVKYIVKLLIVVLRVPSSGF